MPTVRNVSADRIPSKVTTDTLLSPIAQAVELAVSVDCVRQCAFAPAFLRHVGTNH